MNEKQTPCFIQTVKFNNEFFEHGEIISVVTKNDESFVGRLLIKGSDNGDFTCKRYLALDTSEAFNQKRNFIYYSDIKEIYRNKYN